MKNTKFIFLAGMVFLIIFLQGCVADYGKGRETTEFQVTLAGVPSTLVNSRCVERAQSLNFDVEGCISLGHRGTMYDCKCILND